MALWVEMDLLTSCTVFKNRLKNLLDLSDLVGYRSYFNPIAYGNFKFLSAKGAGGGQHLRKTG